MDHDDLQDPHLANEFDVDVTDEGTPDTVRDNIEFLGEYSSVQAYLESVLGDLMTPEIIRCMRENPCTWSSPGARFMAPGSDRYKSSP